jgi:carbonic anhydrase
VTKLSHTNDRSRDRVCKTCGTKQASEDAAQIEATAETDTALHGHGEGHVAHWGYEADNGPDSWDSMDPEWRLCADGRGQSPIDLANAIEIDLPAVDINTPSEQEVEVLN